MSCPGAVGRPLADRPALFRAFIATSVHAVPLTSPLIDGLKSGRTLRTLCGWSHPGEALARRSAGYRTAEDVRCRERTTAERVNGRLKDEFGGRNVQVHGAAKVMCHLMIGVLALTVDQLMRLIN